MGPVRQNPIQRTVRTGHLSVLMTVHNFQYTIQHRTVPLLPPDNHHSSDVVYQRSRGGLYLSQCGPEYNTHEVCQEVTYRPANSLSRYLAASRAPYTSPCSANTYCFMSLFSLLSSCISASNCAGAFSTLLRFSISSSC